MGLIGLFQLYIVAQKYPIDRLQDEIVDITYAKLETDADIWAAIGLDSEAFHELKASMPSLCPHVQAPRTFHSSLNAAANWAPRARLRPHHLRGLVRTTPR